MKNCLAAVEKLPALEKAWMRIAPSAVIQRVNTNIVLQEMMATIIGGCKRPVLIPITRSTLEGSSNEADSINTVAFIAAHAIQILMFAPMDWDGDRQYEIGPEAYRH